MPRKVSSKYKIERGRTLQKVELPASDLEDSESEASVSSENDEEYNAEDGEYNEDEDEEVEYQRPRRGQPKRGVGRITRNTRSGKANSKGSDSGDDESDVGTERNKEQTRLRKQPATTRRHIAPTKSSVLPDSDDDEYNDASDSITDEEDDLEDEEEKGGKKNRRIQKNRKLVARTTSRSTRSSRSRSEGGGDILATLASPPSTSNRRSAVKAKRKSTMTVAKEAMKHDDSDDSDDDDDDRATTVRGSGNDEDSDYDDEEEKEVDELLQKRSKDDFLRSNSRSVTKEKKRKKAVHSSDEEFLLESDDDGDDSLSNDYNAELTEDDNDILMIGDPDLSDDDSDHNNVVDKGNNHATNIVNIDNENFGTIDDEDEDDDPCNDERSPKRLPFARKNEILPSPRGIENTFESDDDRSDEDNSEAYSKMTTKFRRKAKCPKCPSTEDAITAEALPELHVCYIAPDGKSRQCFNLETLRQIALKSSQLQLRVDIDGERQNFLQPPAFRTAMSDDLVDQIASKFGRGALDLHGAYYKNRQTKHENKDEDDQYAYPSDSSNDENIYDSFAAFRERLKDYFKNGMGSQDIYVCPLCYGRIHRTIANPPTSDDDNDDDDDDADKEYDAAPSDSIYDPIMVLGHLDNDHMSIASQFCFKKLADVKEHLRQEHNLDTRGIQGNELYKRFRVRAPDGLLQRWLSTQSLGGQVKQGHMRMYWNQGNDQIFIHLLDLIERVKAYAVGSLQSGDDSSEEDGADDELDENANKAREFFDTFATKASRLWNIISSPFLKSNDNINDFIAKDDDYIEEKDIDEQPHAVLHRHFMNSMNEDSDENDLVHKLKRKYAETKDEETDSKGSSSEEELEFVDGDKESNDENEDDGKEIYNRNGYYSPVEEEEDEWILKLQSQRKRKTSSQKKQEGTNTKLKTPVGKKLFRRKTPPTGTSSSIPGPSKKKRILTIEDSSDDESF